MVARPRYGSREDLMVLGRAGVPSPRVIWCRDTGIGHEDDLTVADLVATTERQRQQRPSSVCRHRERQLFCNCKNGNDVSPVNANGGLSGNAG